MKFKDYYEVLGLSDTASADEIKSAYRRLARKYHPDVSKEKNAEERFKAINEAYEALKDPDKRKAYDDLKRGGFRAGDDFRPPPGWGSGRGGFEYDPGDPQSAGFGEFFESLFGAGGRRARGPSRRGADVTARLSVDLETAFAGGAQRVSLSRGGEQKSLDVKIPAGILGGQTIRLAGQGEQGPAGNGDLLLEIEIAPHPRYSLDGRDVILRLPIAPWEAALGATIEVPTLAGPVGMRIPEASATGRKLRLKGRGMPGATTGDQYVVLEIQTPPASTQAQRRFYEDMRATFDYDPRAAM
jgi:curved DNA-binding protein